jgi:hypothetical protein
MKLFKHKSSAKYFFNRIIFLIKRFIIWIFFSDYFIHDSAVLSKPADKDDTTHFIKGNAFSQIKKLEKKIRKKYR